MRIATLQFAPRLGKVESNIRRADELLNAATKRFNGGDKRSLDLLVLPEMAFSGYNFSSLNTIKPYLEQTEAGRSAEWARSTARRLGCTVCVGYPEIRGKLRDTYPNRSSTPERTGSPSSESRFNSLVIVDSAGDTLLNYQKRFLYYTDEPWAEEGENGKGNISLPISKRDWDWPTDLPSQQPIPASTARDGASSSAPDDSNDSNSALTSIPTVAGICMDINPYRFVAPYSAYEFATHVLDSGARLVVLSTAWLTLLTPEELRAASTTPDMETFRYWIGRFWPFISGERWDGGEIVIVFANRCGREEGLEGKDEALYAGTSCVMSIRRPERKHGGERDEETRDDDHAGVDGKGDPADAEIAVWEMLGRAEEGVCFADTDSEPKTVFRVGGRGAG